MFDGLKYLDYESAAPYENLEVDENIKISLFLVDYVMKEGEKEHGRVLPHKRNKTIKKRSVR